MAHGILLFNTNSKFRNFENYIRDGAVQCVGYSRIETVHSVVRTAELNNIAGFFRGEDSF